MLKSISSEFIPVKWPVQNVQAFTTTINHPDPSNHSIITDQYGAFNLGLHVGDNENKVRNNRKYLLDHFPDNTKIQWLEQVHGNNVIAVKHEQKNIIADAVVTDKNNLALSIMTADCLPIILSTIDGNIIAAIHGGWKPLAKGIIENTVKEMDISPESIYAWLGPCIGNDNFEVGAEVYQLFTTLNSDHKKAFTQLPLLNSQPKYLANLQLIAKQQLNCLGITHLFSVPECTYDNAERYYSFRRTPITGRMATLICII